MSGRDRRLDALEQRVGRVHVPRSGTHAEPFAGTMLDAMDAAGLSGPSWAAWRTFWRAVFALPLGDAERAVFERHTARSAAPPAPVREAWQIVGRRGGKSRNAAVAAAFLAVRQDYAPLLAPGERGVIPILAADRTQAGQVLGYLKGLARREQFAPHVARILKEAVEFRTGVTVRVHTASYRTTRGYTVVGLVADEIAFWRSDDEGVNPDSEVLAALRPGMLTIPGALLLAMSTPYACRGELYRAHERYFGRDDPRVLVWNADTRSMNPGADAGAIREAFEEDPARAAAEYGEDGRVQFRRDVQALLDAEAVRAAMVPGRRELPPVGGVSYVAFTDPSGGSQDAMTLAVAHRAGERAVLDCLREVQPPFSPEAVVEEFAAVLRAYGVTEVCGDRYAGEWPRERFAVHGLRYVPSELSKSDLYRELVPLVNGARVELLDLPRLYGQLVGLERRVARGGRDSVDHPPGGRDDVANAAAGALAFAAGTPSPLLAALLERAVSAALPPLELPA